MNETTRTLIYGGVALFLALLAFVTTPRRVTPDALYDIGEEFFPEFTDPNIAASLEVIDYDEETGTARPFKVQNDQGKWTIPSHHNYPADGKDRLAQTAASVIGIKKDEFRTDNASDHEALGVLDPLDESLATLKGGGQRITIKGQNDEVLADLIVSSKDIEGREKFRYVRLPDQKRVYAARMNIDVSTKFSDWIEADLLQVNKDDIDHVVLKDYSIDERTQSVQQRDVVTLENDGSTWQADKMKADEEIDNTKMNTFLSTLDDLKIVGVRVKPEGLTQYLSAKGNGFDVSMEDRLSLQSKGYYFTRDGQLLSNEGEVQARTKDGVNYTLRFGEIVYGSGLAVTAGTSADTTESESGENRYLFVTTQFEPKLFPEPEKPANTEFTAKADSLWSDADRKNKALQDAWDAWQAKVDKGKQLSEDLNIRFAQWYYVISSGSFDKLHLTRKDLVKKQEKKENS
jgi:ribose 1,5-bisphosphokinase PhnN